MKRGKWSENEVAVLIRLVKSGVDLESIAAHLDRPLSPVRQQLYKLAKDPEHNLSASPVYVRNCIACSREFIATRKDTRCCSVKCSQSNYRRLRKENPTTCTATNCDYIVRADGLCKTHYERRNRGEPDWDRPIKRQRRANKVVNGWKICNTCGKNKPVSEFSLKDKNRSATYRAARCRKCYNELQRPFSTERHRAWRAGKTPEQLKEIYLRSNLKKSFGITLEEYNDKLAEQDYVCAICLKGCRVKSRLAVDHCHSTGQIRGLLCALCNAGLGHFKDDPYLLTGAINYLRKWNQSLEVLSINPREEEPA